MNDRLCSVCKRRLGAHRAGDNRCPGRDDNHELSPNKREWKSTTLVPGLIVPTTFIEQVKEAGRLFQEYTNTSESYVGYKRIRLKARKAMAAVRDSLAKLEAGK